jgi:hypothetical protein
MIRLPAALLAALTLAACSVAKEPPRQIPILRATVLPLSLSDDFSIRKVSTFLNDPRLEPKAVAETIIFERQHLNYGAVTSIDLLERYGHYYNVWWRAKRPADVTVRLEYRQENLGSHVQAKEIHYRAARGTIESKFTIIGDEYTENGKVKAWRLLLIENGRIVGLRQSFLWN